MLEAFLRCHPRYFGPNKIKKLFVIHDPSIRVEDDLVPVVVSCQRYWIEVNARSSRRCKGIACKPVLLYRLPQDAAVVQHLLEVGKAVDSP